MQTPSVVIIGAGIGGLAAAVRLAHAGMAVTVLEAQDAPGGKMRTVETKAGPVDAGPTVLTMRSVFEDLFRDVGENPSDWVTLTPLTVLARHFWADGTTLDLFPDPEASGRAIAAVFGDRAAKDFAKFRARAARLFDAFDAPMMQAAIPTQQALTSRVMRQPSLMRDMAPHRTLHGLLQDSFREPKLRQLFGRYATYVGGSPLQSPALLSLIWRAEEAGVWAVDGGMHKLAQALESLAKARGAAFHYASPVRRVPVQGGRVSTVETVAGRFAADYVLFNGDPAALHTGLLGDGVKRAVDAEAVTPRSLSAHVMAFSAAYNGPALAHHSVFFADRETAEFEPLSRGVMPDDATLYICAQDHPAPATTPQRFEVIRNAPPDMPHSQEANDRCQTHIMTRLAKFGLTFAPEPDVSWLTAPADFARLFPASGGSLYGRSPHGMMAAFKRPVARTAVKGLYLCGGGTHPGAGVPMATLSGRHAAAAIMSDHGSTLPSPRTVTRGGMSTA